MCLVCQQEADLLETRTDTRWWNDEVKDAISVKRKRPRRSGKHQEGKKRDGYRQANKEAKKKVARSKAQAMDDVYEESETAWGKRKIYRIAKALVMQINHRFH